MSSEIVDVVVVGAGVIGCAVARHLALTGREVLALEKNPGVTSGENQSSRNSGVIHAGLYYDRQTRPLKAALCPVGNRLLRQFCADHGVPHLRCGKLLVATDVEQLTTLRVYLERARQNGVAARIVEADEARALEPNVATVGALLLPDSGVVEPTALVRALHAGAAQAGARFVAGAELMAVRPLADRFELTVRRPDGQLEGLAARWLINSAGLWSDQVARMVDPACQARIDPMRGEAAWFRRGARPQLDAARLNVYPTPHQVRLPGGVYWTVGVHLTPTLEPPGPAGGPARLSEVVSVGPLNFAAAHRGDLAGEPRPMASFRQAVAGFFPQLRESDLRPYQVGVQARLSGRQDWLIAPDRRWPRCINLLGVDSPGLTSCLAIAAHVAGLMTAPA